jgi:hypothetical protein
VSDPGSPAVGPNDPTPVEGIPATLARLDSIATKLAKAAAAPHPADSDERLTAVESAVKWASPWRQLLGFVAFLVVGGIAVYTALASYAKDAVVETMKAAHQDEEEPVKPTVQEVNKLKEDVGSVKSGVEALVKEKETRQAVKKIEVELELHQQQHDETMQEWSLKKAARRRAGDKPQKTPRHIQLEAQRNTLLNEGTP